MKPPGDEYVYLCYEGTIDILDSKVFNSIMKIKNQNISNVISGIVINNYAIVLGLLSNDIVIVTNYLGSYSINIILAKNYANKMLEYIPVANTTSSFYCT